ncbi:MAG: hypothetical protein U1E60_01560 [Reyranellaceae bacterium]
MDARVLIAATLGGLALTACNPLPRPDYVDVQQPASYRVEQGGTRIDNANYKLDNQGYRLDDQGERVGMIDVPEKTAGDNSNAVAGYYISTTGQMAPGRVASTSDVVPTVSNEPTPSQMPQQVPISPTPGNTPPPAGYGTPGNNPGNK